MAIRCVFFTPDASNCCQVLQLAADSVQVKLAQKQLADRYCGSGRFISCPIFNRVEQCLAEAHRRRGNMAKISHPTTARSNAQAISR